ncbi:MAG: flagellar basal body rod protein FlgB [Bacteriovoracaceae bacterium]|nr:flagellar basal body rod protein FlgB [Bacteriovoracaceae bacterium]
MEINDKTLQAMANALNFRQMKQEIMASNVANADTPDYKAKKVDFESALARAIDVDGKMKMQTTDSKHFDVGNGGFNNLQPEIYNDPNGVVSENGNTVDVEAEMAQIAENKILYDALVQLVNKKMGMMKYAISSEK